MTTINKTKTMNNEQKEKYLRDKKWRQVKDRFGSRNMWQKGIIIEETNSARDMQQKADEEDKRRAEDKIKHDNQQ